MSTITDPIIPAPIPDPVPEPTPSPFASVKLPDITPAQILGGIPVLADLGHSFGVFTLNAAEQASLSKAVTWALALIGGDAVIRLGRALGLGLATKP